MDNIPQQQAPSVAIIILNWNGKADTLECLASVSNIDYPHFSVVVVDNGSMDDSVAAIRHEYPQLRVMETGQNLGYAGGNNVGIQWALEHGATYVLLLNNDAIVAPTLLQDFVSVARMHQDGGMFSPRIEYFSEPGRIWNSGIVWNRQLGRFDALEIKSGVQETAASNGCALFVPSSVIRHIGLLDERFFLTYEETDWSYRAKEAGYRCYVVADALVRHKVSASIGGSESPLACYFWVRNQLFWAKRHLSLLDRVAASLAILRRISRGFIPPFVTQSTVGGGKKLLWAVASWWRNLLRNLKSPSNRAFLIGLNDYLHGRMGDCPEKVRHWTEDAKAKSRLRSEATKLNVLP